MKVIITRTSNWEDKPCVEAIKITVPFWHIRTCTESYFDEHFSDREGTWRSKGKGHMVFKGRTDVLCPLWIARQEDDREVWGIEVSNLEELLKLGIKYGPLIISKYNSNKPNTQEPIWEIEIYDDYQ